ncbi:hypothetical protein [Isoptericola rhizosphaerae]|uniref:hypothetical protein n=1 Tax=Isoptericola rhizosphaerae TaxID=3377837 RepID=UPI00383A7D0B
MSTSPERRLLAAVASRSARTRFEAKVRRLDHVECWIWTGAISGQGHGRFWVAQGHVVIAHRFAYMASIPSPVLGDVPAVVAHRCDNPLCQNPAHLTPSSPALNRAEWASRRHVPGGPLRDVRGARGRAHELRDAAKAGASIAETMSAGLRCVDRGQGRLW